MQNAKCKIAKVENAKQKMQGSVGRQAIGV
jgi:hypothetical protein